MSDNEQPAKGEAWIQFLIRKKRFAECMILAWQGVEDGIDQMIVQEFNLIYSPKKLDPRVDLLRGIMSIRTKTDFLESMGRLSRQDVNAIAKFQKERNNLFHGFLYESRHPVAMPEKEKEALMELAGRTSQLVLNRSFDTWFDKSTGDLANEHTPRPRRPKGAVFADEERKKSILRWNTEETRIQGDES